MYEEAFKNIDNVFWKDAGCSSELDYVEQTSWILFLKYLDDYEEGSHTFADGSAGLSITNNNTGKYTKIGRMVLITFDLTWPSTSDTNISRVTSPFTAGTGYGNGWVGWCELGRPVQIHVSGSTVYFMDNNVGGTGKHLYNNELSGKRFIGAFTLQV